MSNILNYNQLIKRDSDSINCIMVVVKVVVVKIIVSTIIPYVVLE